MCLNSNICHLCVWQVQLFICTCLFSPSSLVTEPRFHLGQPRKQLTFPEPGQRSRPRPGKRSQVDVSRKSFAFLKEKCRSWWKPLSSFPCYECSCKEVKPTCWAWQWRKTKILHPWTHYLAVAKLMSATTYLPRKRNPCLIYPPWISYSVSCS